MKKRKILRERRKRFKILSAVVALVMVAALGVGIFMNNGTQVQAAENTTADGSTMTDWQNYAQDSTQYTGRIWTDKSVTNEAAVTLSNVEGTETVRVDKTQNADFLVSLSALSSASSLTVNIAQPLDIVLVLDQSGSMAYDFDGNYTGNNSQRRQYAMKTAVTNFIGQIYANAMLDEAGGVNHRLGIVTYGSNSSDLVQLDYIETNHESAVQAVNRLPDSPSGATNTAAGMTRAYNMLPNKTGDRKSVVVLFTDGVPTTGTTFDQTVADNAIRAAYNMKNTKGAMVYSIGIFEGADTSFLGNVGDTYSGWRGYSEDQKANRFMQLVSSNATTADSMGVDENIIQADSIDTNFDTDISKGYYKTAGNADDLNNVFEEIADSIAEPAGPTVITDGAADTSGYITFTDTLGDYMHIDDVNAIVYAGEKFEKKTVSSDGTTYTFEGTVEGNDVYGEADLADIIINVDKTGKGDTITVKIPASLIPLRYFEVEDGKMTIKDAYPIRVFYSVSLKEEVQEALANGTTDQDLQNYISAHLNAADGTASFYSNAYTSGNRGTTTAVFTPAPTNSFYFFTQPTQLLDRNGDPIRDFQKGNTYYYLNQYYKEGNTEAQTRLEEISSLSTGDVTLGEDGTIFVNAGVRKTSRAGEFQSGKAENITQTAENVISPTWPEETDDVTVYLGNNGLLKLDVPGTLSITKKVAASEGFEIPDENQEFTFTLHLSGLDQDDPQAFQAVKGDDIEHAVSIGDGDTFTLKKDETLTISGLPAGVTYRVEEASVNGYSTTIADSDGDDKTDGAGTIIANQQSTVEFTNTYSADPITLPSDAVSGLQVEKVVEGAPAYEDFTFSIALSDSNEGPADGVTGVDNNTVTINMEDLQLQEDADRVSATEAFGPITFTKPGIYTFDIQETNSDGRTGWTYDNDAARTVTVTIVDDGEGHLTLAEEDGIVYQNADGTAADSASFTNSYETQPTTVNGNDIGLGGTKTLTGRDSQEGEAFTFTLTPTSDTQVAITDRKLEISDNNSEVSVTELTNGQGKGFTFGANITIYEAGDYTFNVTETVPDDAVNPSVNDGNTTYADAAASDKAREGWTLNGVTYDNHVGTVTVKATDTDYDGDFELQAVPEEGDADVSFENVYASAPIVYGNDTNEILGGHKFIADDTGSFTLEDGQFTFYMRAQQAGNPMPEESDAVDIVNDAEGRPVAVTKNAGNSYDFGEITFTQVGVYRYNIYEERVEDIPAGITCDSATYTVTFDVRDDGRGNLYIYNGPTAVKVTGGSGENVPVNMDELDFTNEFNATSLSNSLPIFKTLNGRDFIENDEFQFHITVSAVDEQGQKIAFDDLPKPVEGEGEILSSPVEDENGYSYDVTIQPFGSATGNTYVTSTGTITYTHTGTYTYTVEETDTGIPGVQYDAKKYTVTVVISTEEQPDGTVRLSRTATVDPALDEGRLSFTNVYRPGAVELAGDNALDVSKMVTGAPTEEDFVFGLTLTQGRESVLVGTGENATAFPEEGITVTMSDSFAANTQQTASFEDLTFTAAGDYVFQVNETNSDPLASTGWTYDNDTPRTITVRVTDTDYDGQLDIDLPGGVEGNNPVFTNSYVPTGVIVGDDEAQLQVTKQVTGAPALSEFAFTLQLTSDNAAYVEGLGEGNALTESTTGLTGTENSETVNFGDLTFTAAGDYVFTVTEDTEKPAGADGWTYDNNPRTITVHVTDDNYDGQLDATVENNNPVITNSYVPTGVIVGDDETQLQVTKQVTGAPALSEFVFTLQLTSDNAANVEGLEEGNAITKSTTGLEGTEDRETVDFGELTFTAAGDYVFTVKEDTEKPADADGWTYDNSSYTITVHVTDENYDGQLDATVEGNNPTVTNQYKANEVVIGGDSGNAGIAVQKTLLGRNWQEGDSFSFTLAAADGTPMPVEGEEIVTISNEDTEKTAEFGAITYTETGTYHYTVTEAGGNIGGVTYDKHIANVTVNVTDENYDGQLDAEVTYDNNTEGVYEDDADVTTIAAFTNTYEPGGTVQPGTGDAEAQLTKELVGRDWMEGDQFSFTITADEDTPAETLPAETTVTVGKPESGNSNTFDFGPFTFNAEGVYHYTVREEGAGTTVNGITYSNNVAHITIDVTDDLQGGFAASVTITNEKFINTYSAGLDYGAEGGLNLVKRLDGHDIAAGQFQFQVTPVSGDGYVSAEDAAKKAGIEESGLTVSTDAASMVDGVAVDSIALFNQMKFDQTDNGKTYAYQISEVQETKAGYQYDKTTYTVTISVSDDNNGVLTVTTVVSNGTDSTAYVYTSEDGQNTPAQVVFNNAYDGAGSLGGEGAVSIQADKELLNGQLSGNDFTFIVTDKNEAEVTRGTNDASGKITFNEVAYTTDKLIADLASGAASYDADSSTYTYQYTVTEDTSNFQDMGVIANVAHFNITVTVKDNGDGTLTTAVDYGQYGDGLTFQNTYGTGADIAVNIGGTKELAHADGLTPPDITGAYQFTISGQDENGNAAPLPENTTASNDANGNVSFGAIQYTMENVFGTTAGEAASDDAAAGEDGIDTQIAQRTKTYTYTVTESGNVAGVTNDQEASKTFTIVVTDNGDGTLSVTDGAGNTVVPGAQFTFVNTYSVTPSTSTPTGDGGITITKNLEGRALNEGEFTFEMTGLAGTISEGMAVTGTNDAAGNVALGGLEFSRPGTYEFRISEVIPETPAGGVTYDGMTYQATAEVTDNHDGTLAVAWTVKAAADGETLEQVTFTNTYKAAPAGVQFGALKRLDGDARDLKAGEFTFQVKDESGKVVATAKNKADGSVRFDSITFDKAGTYTYTISEVKGSDETITYDETVYTAIVNVTDDLNGQLYASVTAGDGSALKMTFTNKYTKPAVPVEPDEGPTAVRTGDTAPILPIILVMAAALAAIIAAAAVILRRNRRQ